ncbi:MAG: hypothetical protein M3396_06255 [Actinomycetota bacterium]|nr:hypothetical protein [Actinomycetota bacterium]
MRRRRLVTTAAVAVTAMALFGCGGDAKSGDTLSDLAANDLRAKVGQVRAAASAGDRTGAGAGLAAVRSAVAQHRSQGQISEERATAILSAAAEVEARLSLLVSPPPPTTTTAAPRRSPPVTEGDGDKDDDGKGKGEGRKRGDD